MRAKSIIINGEEQNLGEVYTAGYNINISNDNVISTNRQPDHYLGHWNCEEGQSPDFLETAPYEYNAGDYYIVNKTADMSWMNMYEMLGEGYRIPSYEDMLDLYSKMHMIDEEEGSESKSTKTSSDSPSSSYYEDGKVVNDLITILGLPEGATAPSLDDYFSFFNIQEAINYHAGGIWLSDGVVVFQGTRSNSYEVTFANAASYEFKEAETRPMIYQIRAFKDIPVIPDNTWTQLLDGSIVSGISGTGVYKNETLGLITFVFPGRDDNLEEFTNEFTYTTVKDKNIGATEFGGIGYGYQWGNCNNIEMPNYEIDYNSVIDFDGVDPSTYSSDVWIYDVPGQYDNYIDAWGSVTDTNAARRGPCPEGWHVPKIDEAYIGLYALTAYSTWHNGLDINGLDFEDIFGMYDYVIGIFNSDMSDNCPRGHILPAKNDSSFPPSQDGWTILGTRYFGGGGGGGRNSQKISRDNSIPDHIMFAHNPSLGEFFAIAYDSNDTPISTYRLADKFLGATEIIDFYYDSENNYCYKGGLYNLGYTYQRGNNYAFNFNPEIYENILDPSNITYQTIYNARPFQYNGNIIHGGGGKKSNIKLLDESKSSTKAAPSYTEFATYEINISLWNYVEPTHNLRPKGSEYVENPLTDSEIENERVDINDIYLYDGTQWILIDNHIVPHVFVTQTEYDSISDKKYHNGTLYLFVDKHPGDPSGPGCDDLHEYEDFEFVSPRSNSDTKAAPTIIGSTATEWTASCVEELNRCPQGYYDKFLEESHLGGGRSTRISADNYLYLGERMEDASKGFSRWTAYNSSTGYTYYIRVDVDTYEWSSEAEEPSVISV